MANTDSLREQNKVTRVIAIYLLRRYKILQFYSGRNRRLIILDKVLVTTVVTKIPSSARSDISVKIKEGYTFLNIHEFTPSAYVSIPGCTSYSMLQIAKIVGLVLLWWIANGLTSIYSKTEMSTPTLKRSFSELKWLDLTILQFLFGVFASGTWISLIEGRSLILQRVSNWNGCVVILGNLIGHLSVNLSYTFVSSSATQVVKSSEPMFMFLFLVCLRSKHIQQQNINTLALFSIVLMVLGTYLFVIWDMTFNVWGIVAAITSSIAFTLRNLALKDMNQQFNSPFEKYFILSFYGTCLLFLLRVLLFLFQNTSSFYLSQTGITAGSRA